MKYNRSEIMTRAWSIRRMTACTMSTALTQAWAEAKKPSYEIVGWFMSRNFSSNERLAVFGVEPYRMSETEKAVKLCWATSYGKIIRWVPKSCLVTAESLAAENTAEKCAARLAAMKAREDRYNAMIAECRAHGIPARKGWRVATMKARLAEVA